MLDPPWSPESIATLPPLGPRYIGVFPDFQPMRVSEEPVCIYLFRQNPAFEIFLFMSYRHWMKLAPTRDTFHETGDPARLAA
jgi:hypothetical protein